MKVNQVKCWFLRRGETGVPGENLSVQSREPTNPNHIWRRVWESKPGHIGGKRVLSPLRHPCIPNTIWTEQNIQQQQSRIPTSRRQDTCSWLLTSAAEKFEPVTTRNKFNESPHGFTATLTMLWRNSWSITGQTHDKLIPNIQRFKWGH